MARPSSAGVPTVTIPWLHDGGDADGDIGATIAFRRHFPAHLIRSAHALLRRGIDGIVAGAQILAVNQRKPHAHHAEFPL